MNKKEQEAFAKEAAKGIKTEKELAEFSQMLTKITVEAAPNAELDEHLGYGKHTQSDLGNNRNGLTCKQLQTEKGTIELADPRDRNSNIELQLVKKINAASAQWDDKYPQSSIS